MVALHCGHAFCKECWQQYLSIQIKERKTLLCCGRDGDVKCQAVVDEFTVMSLVDDEDCRNIYKRSLTDSFVEDNIDCKWCPAPGTFHHVLVVFSIVLYVAGHSIVVSVLSLGLAHLLDMSVLQR